MRKQVGARHWKALNARHLSWHFILEQFDLDSNGESLKIFMQS